MLIKHSIWAFQTGLSSSHAKYLSYGFSISIYQEIESRLKNIATELHQSTIEFYIMSSTVARYFQEHHQKT